MTFRLPRVNPLVLGAVMTLASAHLAFGHIQVLPSESTQGYQFEKYTVRVPNEKEVACIRIEAEFPTDVEVYRFEFKPGWKIDSKKDDKGKIVGAVWTGNIPPERFVEFGLMGRNSKTASSLVWKFVEYYEDGSKDEYVGPRGSPLPSPVTTLMPAKARGTGLGN